MTPLEALLIGIVIGFVGMGVIGDRYRKWEWLRKRFNITD